MSNQNTELVNIMHGVTPVVHLPEPYSRHHFNPDGHPEPNATYNLSLLVPVPLPQNTFDQSKNNTSPNNGDSGEFAFSNIICQSLSEHSQHPVSSTNAQQQQQQQMVSFSSMPPTHVVAAAPMNHSLHNTFVLHHQHHHHVMHHHHQNGMHHHHHYHSHSPFGATLLAPATVPGYINPLTTHTVAHTVMNTAAIPTSPNQPPINQLLPGQPQQQQQLQHCSKGPDALPSGSAQLIAVNPDMLHIFDMKTHMRAMPHTAAVNGGASLLQSLPAADAQPLQAQLSIASQQSSSMNPDDINNSLTGTTSFQFHTKQTSCEECGSATHTAGGTGADTAPGSYPVMTSGAAFTEVCGDQSSHNPAVPASAATTTKPASFLPLTPSPSDSECHACCQATEQKTPNVGDHRASTDLTAATTTHREHTIISHRQSKNTHSHRGTSADAAVASSGNGGTTNTPNAVVHNATTAAQTHPPLSKKATRKLLKFEQLRKHHEENWEREINMWKQCVKEHPLVSTVAADWRAGFWHPPWTNDAHVMSFVQSVLKEAQNPDYPLTQNHRHFPRPRHTVLTFLNKIMDFEPTNVLKDAFNAMDALRQFTVLVTLCQVNTEEYFLR